MKTQQEIEKMLKEIQEDIDKFGELARKQNQERNQDLYEYYQKIYSNKIAQYNILLDVLK